MKFADDPSSKSSFGVQMSTPFRCGEIVLVFTFFHACGFLGVSFEVQPMQSKHRCVTVSLGEEVAALKESSVLPSLAPACPRKPTLDE